MDVRNGAAFRVFRVDDAMLHIRWTRRRRPLNGTATISRSAAPSSRSAAHSCVGTPRPTDCGAEILTQNPRRGLPERMPSLVPVVELFVDRERAFCSGDREAALPPVMRAAADHLFEEGRFGWCVCGTAFSSRRCCAGNGDELAGRAWIRLLAGLPAAAGAILDITVLRLRTAGPRPW